MAKAYLIAVSTATDLEAHRNGYGLKVEATFKPFGGAYLARGGDIFYEEGDLPGDRAVIIEFPSRTAAQDWVNSPEYQAIIHHRINNTIGIVIMTEGVPQL
jgi:uncharacterized protein (DUF1330 family)